jgi:hypothetical protein
LSSPIVVTGGVHGNEPSGAMALQALARRGFVTAPPCNPWGLLHGRRELESGRDLNRAFADPRCEEAELVRQFLRDHPPALLLDLHEDSRTRAPYLIQYGPEDDIGERIIAELSARYAFAARPRFGPVLGRRGLIHPPRWMVAVVGLSPWWPLVYYAYRTFGATGCVVEAPGTWPIADRIELHIAVVETAAKCLR